MKKFPLQRINSLQELSGVDIIFFGLVFFPFVDIRDIATMFPVSFGAYSKIVRKKGSIIPQDVVDLICAPYIIFTFFSFAIRIQGREKTTFPRRKLPFYEFNCFINYFFVEGSFSKLKSMAVK